MDNRIPSTLFLDIGGVLLTNGWDHRSRQEAARQFNLDYEEMNERHHLTYDTYESGKLSLNEYLDRVVFYEERLFTYEDFRKFMFERSRSFPDMIDLVKNLKRKHGLKVGAISNEGRELTEYRIKKFRLGEFMDFFVSSCFVHFRKPDKDIYRIALDVAQTVPEESVYVDDRAMFVRVAESLGIRSVIHVDGQKTMSVLKTFGLSL
ncbi:MAG: HAD family phosphatase [Bacteroidetes bacterium]|nr:HAD family phosphatase [Bacteroidota bacterium]